MPALRLAAAVLAMLAFAPAANAAVAGPGGLRPFLLRADEAPARTFVRTPSFAWRPVRGARYEFELSTRRNFGDSTIVYSASNLKLPTVAIPIALPWMTGTPYALWAHVRAVTRRGTSAWSAPYGFNMRWANTPAVLPSPAGLVRWSPVEGATGYNVWFLGFNKVVATKTNVADEREHWTFHQDPAWTSVVRWRVRAVRSRPGGSLNGVPAVTYGPWSPVHVEFNPPLSGTPLATQSMASDAYTSQASPFRLMPGLSYGGSVSFDSSPRELYRTYITTDRDCVNIVYRGSIVGSPAWAPRTTGPLIFPANGDDLQKARSGWIISDGRQGKTFAVDNSPVWENESRTLGSAPTDGATGGIPETDDPDLDAVQRATLAPPLVDLWDNGWPDSRYYWTVVGVEMRAGTTDRNQLEYHDVELPQDACAAGRVATFGKISEAVVTAAGAPYVSGLSTNGSLFTASRARPSVYGSPHVAWKPALGADSYEVQWSRKRYPWRKAGAFETPSTSATLPLRPGRWYYRVRGISLALPLGGRQMTWSDPVPVRVARPRFRIVRG